MDEKAWRMRGLLASFYNTYPLAVGPDAAPASPAQPFPTVASASPLDSINSTSFNLDIYMDVLRHVKMATEIKNLDTDLQMLVYVNYNKFINATDTIKRMKTNIVGLEANMEQLLAKDHLRRILKGQVSLFDWSTSTSLARSFSVFFPCAGEPN